MTDWRDRAACLGADDEVFFPDRGDTAGADAALRICATCPVTTECLAAALTEEGNLAGQYRHGIRGGTTPEQRAHMTGITPEPRARIRRLP